MNDDCDLVEWTIRNRSCVHERCGAPIFVLDYPETEERIAAAWALSVACVEAGLCPCCMRDALYVRIDAAGSLPDTGVFVRLAPLNSPETIGAWRGITSMYRLDEFGNCRPCDKRFGVRIASADDVAVDFARAVGEPIMLQYDFAPNPPVDFVTGKREAATPLGCRDELFAEESRRAPHYGRQIGDKTFADWAESDSRPAHER